MLHPSWFGLVGRISALFAVLGIEAIAFPSAAQADVTVINGRVSIEVGQPYPRYAYPTRVYPRYFPSPVLTERIEDSTLINPVVIGAPIEDSTLINPVIVVPPATGRVIVSPSYRRGQDNPACTTFRSLRPACW